MASPLKPRQDTPEGSPPRPSATQSSPSELAPYDPSQLPKGDLPSDTKECSRCHSEAPLRGFVRSAKDRSTKGFRPEEMKVCNHCGFIQHNARAAGDHKDRIPKSDKMLKQLSEGDYMELYGAEAIIKGTPAGGKKKKKAEKDDEDGDEDGYVPPEA